MQTFKWNNERLELLDSDDFLVGEARWVERFAKQKFSDMGNTDSLISRVLVTLKRKQIHLKWSDFDDMKLGDFDIEDDEPEADESDPTEPGAADPPTESTTAESGTG